MNKLIHVLKVPKVPTNSDWSEQQFFGFNRLEVKQVIAKAICLDPASNVRTPILTEAVIAGAVS